MLFLILLLFVWIFVLQKRLNKLSEKYDILLKDFSEIRQQVSVVQHNDEISHIQTKASSLEQKEENISQQQNEAALDEQRLLEAEANEEQNITEVKEEVVEKVEEKAENIDNSSQEKVQPTPKEPISFVQVFSWIGGFILLLGVMFWIKYAIENNLVSATLRVVLGTLSGIGLWGAGALLRKPNVKTTSDTLCACGLSICYSVWFAAYYFYQMTSPAITFVLLGLISLASFGTAVWKNAQYIGILAQLVGFITPFLFPADQSRLWFFLAYIGIINIASVAAALKRNWKNQLFTGLAFTFLCFVSVMKGGSLLQISIFPAIFTMMYAWVAISQKQKNLLRLTFIFALLGLMILGLQNYTFQPKYLKDILNNLENTTFGFTPIMLPLVLIDLIVNGMFAFSLPLENLVYIITFAGFFAISFGILAIKQKNKELTFATLVFSFISFILIGLSKSFLPLFIFVVLLSLFFGLLTAKQQNNYLQIGTMVLSTLGFITIFQTGSVVKLEASYLPYLAAFTSIFGIFFGIIAYKQKNTLLMFNTILLTLICFGFLISFKNITYLLVVASLFTLFFGLLSMNISSFNSLIASTIFTSVCAILISLFVPQYYHAILAFSLISMIFYCVIAVKWRNGILYALSAISMIIPLFILTVYTLMKGKADELLGWHIFWNIFIMLTPLIAQKRFFESKPAWFSVALSNLFAGIFIFIICEGNKTIYQSAGWVAIIMSLLYTVITYQVFLWQSIDEGIQNFRLTCLAFAPLILLTLGIVTQFHKEWITILLALESLGLIWLWNKAKINILQNFGLGVTAIVIIRLLFNPFIVDYYEETKLIFNWYLHTYIICSIAIFASSYYWRNQTNSIVPKFLNFIGGTLLFALVNIEIANYFSEGRGLPFNFCGNVGEAATYTIAWAFFGAVTMFFNKKKSHYTLKVGIGLISLAVLKLFIFDIWQLSSSLRIVVLIGVAVIMLTVSFVYQQFKGKKKI